MKHRLNLEHISSLSQQTVVQDVAAKIMCDNLQTLAALSAHDQADLRTVDRIDHTYAHTALKPVMPPLLLCKKIASHLRDVLIRLKLLKKNTLTFTAKISQNRASQDRNRTNSWRRNHAKNL